LSSIKFANIGQILKLMRITASGSIIFRYLQGNMR